MTIKDIAYELAPGQHKLDHAYGERVTFLHNPFAMSLMARIGEESCVQPALGDYVNLAYQYLAAEVFEQHLKVETQSVAECWHSKNWSASPSLAPASCPRKFAFEWALRCSE
jgi:hypothetical protein